MNPNTFYMVSLGCAKNTVDSDSMAQLLIQDGYRSIGNSQRAGILIVNTCGFIGAAREESYAELRKLAGTKLPGQLLIAAGCLTQRYGQEVARRVPGVDGILGTRRWMDIVEVVRTLRKGPHPEPLYALPEEPDLHAQDAPASVLRASRFGASAYVKIADGCRRTCAFCAIPLIKGTAVSRPPGLILEDVARLNAQGVREINLIAQDTTDYGYDLEMKDGLAALLERLTGAVPDLDWIRIMYAFPGYVTDRLIDVMASHPQILPYLDIPLQHAHPATLTRMRRPAAMDWVHKTIGKMRQAMPNLAIRTVFIVGYPGETEAEFQTLLDFVQEMRFDHVGAFQFSFEPGTASEPLGDPVPVQVKQERYQRLMELQQSISLQVNQGYVGQTLDVLVEGFNKNLVLGRSYRDAPEVDGMVLIEPERGSQAVHSLSIGDLVPVKIAGAMAYDLTGHLAR
ncbi:MAG TPA: 30S ribosomal protein S12 methylthiotransferase RimO [Anaerolineales bacterium]|nr:30S ribosomal protein S12 methylthiotransferase RimO [Anaerolineales bacterium]